jgi:hypothetical protein
MIACATLHQGSVSQSNQPEHGGCESSSGIDVQRRGMKVTANAKSFLHLSPSIAPKQICLSVNLTVSCGGPKLSICRINNLDGSETIEWE